MNPLYWIHAMLASPNGVERLFGILLVIAAGLLPLVGFAFYRRWDRERKRRMRRLRRRSSQTRLREVTQDDIEATRW